MHKYYHSLQLMRHRPIWITVGGKGQSLARLTAAAFAVPPGFTVTTVAYRQFVAAQHLQEAIIDLAKPEIGARTVSLSRRCSKIST